MLQVYNNLSSCKELIHAEFAPICYLLSCKASAIYITCELFPVCFLSFAKLNNPGASLENTLKLKSAVTPVKDKPRELQKFKRLI